jgi:hypothetical protein
MHECMLDANEWLTSAIAHERYYKRSFRWTRYTFFLK